MSKSHYSRESLASALSEVGLKRGSLVFSHSNIGFFGIPQGERSLDNAFKTILETFLEVLGPEGTLVVPTFSYSFPKGEPYDPANTPSDCGVFAEMLRKYPGALRSDDPCISVAALGNAARELTINAPENAYGEDSFFERFHKHGGVVCNLNFDAGSTFVHYVERCLTVPYRFDKTFTGTLCRAGKCEERKVTLWVRYLTEGTEAQFELFDRLARQEGCFKTSPVGRGCVGLISAADTFSLIKKALPDNPWLLTEAGKRGFVPDLKNAKR